MMLKPEISVSQAMQHAWNQENAYIILVSKFAGNNLILWYALF
jgi:hypothetical protein